MQPTLTVAPTPRYFINEQDEIRSIADPRFYFKYFISKNERWNERQRFAMNSREPLRPYVSPCVHNPPLTHHPQPPSSGRSSAA